MAWETRTRGTRYYTRSRRVGGRVVREYVGAGPLGELTACEDAQRRHDRDAQRAALDAEQRRLDALDAPLRSLDSLADALATGALLCAGYHRHDRGDWRRHREQDKTKKRSEHAG